MSIITLQYLKDIPNLSFSATGGIADNKLNNNEKVQNLLDIAERRFLIEALGLTVTNELYDQFEADGTWKVDALQKYKDLVDGDDTLNWEGLRYEIGENKVSMIANFIYCQWLFNLSQGDLTQLGVSVSEVEQSSIISEAPIFANYWNEMVGMRNYDRYYYYKNDGMPITLEQFLRDSEDFSLDSFQYDGYCYVNRFQL